MKTKKELEYFYRLSKKIIKSGVLTAKEACNLATMFSIFSLDYKTNHGDYLYDPLLDLNIRLYPRGLD